MLLSIRGIFEIKGEFPTELMQTRVTYQTTYNSKLLGGQGQLDLAAPASVFTVPVLVDEARVPYLPT